MPNRVRSLASVLFVMLSWPMFAAAQAPEVMLLIDGSRQMSAAIGPAAMACAPAGTARPVAGVAYQPDSALNLVKEALVGSLRGPRWCITEGPAERAAHRLGPDGNAPHHRAMCCHSAACDRFGPCGEDHDRAVVQAADASAGVSWNDDGLLSQFGGRIKFSMLFTDGAPSTDAGVPGHYSYGPAVDGQNLGARSAAAPTGGFVSAHRGRDGDPARAVDETAPSLTAHAAFVAQRVRALVPHGAAPLAALIEDARLAAAEPDPQQACRSKVAILITRGQPMPSPYGPAAEAAARFRAETGAALHVIVLDAQPGGAAEQWGATVGAAGAPALPLASTRVADLVSLRAALTQILQRHIDPRQHATRPLVLAPAGVDVCPADRPNCTPPAGAVQQWRLTAYTEGAGDGAVGRLHADALSCRAGVTPERTDRLIFEDILAARVAQPRRTLGARGGALLPYTGGADACFDAVGRATCPLAGLDALLGIVGDPAPDRRPGLVSDPPPRRRAGLLLNGHFGPQGLGPNGRRQLGALGKGSLLALRPPALGVTGQGWQRYRQRMDRRPTLVITGADDGGVHLFRARDGVEVLSLVPEVALPALKSGRADAQARLDVGDLLRCRTLEGAADADCPQGAADWPFGAFLTGTVGGAIFGYDLTAVDDLARAADRPLDPVIDRASTWQLTAATARDPAVPNATLGQAIGRPILAHVQAAEGGARRIRAAAVVGCGEAQAGGGNGRCVLVLDARTGSVIRRFDARDNPQMTAALHGDVAAFPAGSITAAERFYLGDVLGRIWRIDARAADPALWQIQIAWPPAGGDARGYQTGRPTIGRPSLAVRPEGGLAVLFATAGAGATPAHWVSFTDAPRLNGGGVGFEVTANWVMPLAPTEIATDGPTVRDGIAYLTTRTEGAGACGAARVEGRLYGVDFVQRYLDAQGNPGRFAFDGRSLDVRPALPRFENGAQAPSAGLAVVLPPGRIAAGLALARTPACRGQTAVDSVVLNLAASAGGPQLQGDAAVRASGIEFVRDERVQSAPLADQMFARSAGQQFDLCLTCQPQGVAPAVGLPPGLPPPFPSRLTYWGSTLMD